MIRPTTSLSVLGVLVLLLVGAGTPSAWSATLALHSSDGTVDKSDPQNGTDDLATAYAAIGESFNELGETRGFVVFDATGIDIANIDTETLTLEVLGGPYFFGTRVAELV